MAYTEYLQTPEWRKRRNRALLRADYQCQLCVSRDQLQVHHRSDERRGVELDTDLTVLCDHCHEHHHRGLRTVVGSVGVHAAVVHELLNTDAFKDYASLKEAVKTRCARLHIPYDSEAIGAALDLVGRSRPVITAADSTSVPSREPGAQPLSREEASRLYQALMARFHAERGPSPAAGERGRPAHFPDLVEVGQ